VTDAETRPGAATGQRHSRLRADSPAGAADMAPPAAGGIPAQAGFGSLETITGLPSRWDLSGVRRIRLADIDGSGTADLFSVGEDGVTAWFNQSGNSWSGPTGIAVFPAADQLSTVQALDLFELTGRQSSLIWHVSGQPVLSPSSKDSRASVSAPPSASAHV
jgi:hypothetical protein